MLSPSAMTFLCGLLAGAVLGVAGRAGRFCTLAMLEDAFFGADTRRLKSFALAAAVALVATQLLSSFGLVDLSRSIYLTASIPIGGAILGGFLFGIGMALVGTCGFGTLVRIGGGDLRAIVVFLVLGVSALAAMRGLTGFVRVGLIEPLSVRLPEAMNQGMDTLLSAAIGSYGRPVIVSLVAVTLAAWALADGQLIRSPRLLLSGLAVGGAVAFGWFATGWLGHDDFDPERVASLTFVAPLGNTVLYIATLSGSHADFAIGAVAFGWFATGWLGHDDFDPERVASLTFVAPLGNTVLYIATLSGSHADFAIGSVAGVILGSFVAAMFSRVFRWEACDDARELKRHMIGALLMGTGGIMSMGCTIGQGLSAFSTLALSAPLTMVAISCGARLGLEYTMTGEWRPAVRNLLRMSS
ncbi:YeeE/YedE family protein [Bradyrhizobium oligotrophicum]|uniref:YeeE/YedE family protein n=1 Tax=Bradyrhizobium oligotrophicum TaxID=44255 RepID=UPI003EC1269B